MAKNTPFIKDWLMLGGISGVMVVLAGEAVNAVLEKAGVPTVRYASMASGFILGKRARFGMFPARPSNAADWAIGWATHAAVGGLFGSYLSYVYSKTPPGNETLKGAFGGVLYWLTTMGIGHQTKVDTLVKVRPVNMATTLALTTLFGAIHGSIIGKYGAKVITQSHPVIVRNMDMQQFDKERHETSRPADRITYQH